MTEAKCILVIRPDEIGDVVLTIPFLRELRRAAPRARIALVVKTACLELVEHSPYVDVACSLNFRLGGGRRYRLRLIWAAWRLRWSQLVWWNFDLALLPRRGPDYYDSELVGRVLAGRSALVVHREERPTSSAFSGDSAFDLYVYSNPVIEHEVLHNLRFLGWCGATDITEPGLEFWVTASDRRFATDALDGRGTCVAFAPGAGDPARCWPIDRFAAVAKWFQDYHGMTPVLLGAPGDPAFNDSVNLIGQTSLREAAAVIEHCILFVGNDSGLMHVAAAMGTPVVEISGFRTGGDPNHHNSPERFGPFGVPKRIVRPAAGRSLFAIEEVMVAAVRLACSDLLVGTPKADHP